MYEILPQTAINSVPSFIALVGRLECPLWLERFAMGKPEYNSLVESY